MIKLVYCITKKAGLTDEEFFHYWENIHGPLGARIPTKSSFITGKISTDPWVLVFLTSADWSRATALSSAEINTRPITMGWWNSGSTTGRRSWPLVNRLNGKRRARTKRTS